jgi:hypothetical protein
MRISQCRIACRGPLRKAYIYGTLAGHISIASAPLAGKLKKAWAKKGRSVTLADAIVAAVAIERWNSLLTDNRKWRVAHGLD